jgi:hypothetical protein
MEIAIFTLNFAQKATPSLAVSFLLLFLASESPPAVNLLEMSLASAQASLLSRRLNEMTNKRCVFNLFVSGSVGSQANRTKIFLAFRTLPNPVLVVEEPFFIATKAIEFP